MSRKMAIDKTYWSYSKLASFEHFCFKVYKAWSQHFKELKNSNLMKLDKTKIWVHSQVKLYNDDLKRLKCLWWSLHKSPNFWRLIHCYNPIIIARTLHPNAWPNGDLKCFSPGEVNYNSGRLSASSLKWLQWWDCMPQHNLWSRSNPRPRLTPTKMIWKWLEPVPKAYVLGHGNVQERKLTSWKIDERLDSISRC